MREMEEEIKRVHDGQCNGLDTEDEQKGSKVDLNDEAVHPKQTFVQNDTSSFVLPKPQNEQRVCRMKKIPRRRRFDDSQQFYKRSHDLETQFTASPTFSPYGRVLPYHNWLWRTQSPYLLLNNIIDFTNLSLSIHMGEPFVKTKAMEEAIKRIDQHNVVILSGLPGSGKTVMGNRLLLELYHKNPTCLIKINDANEFRVSISAKIRSVIFIDDMFGQLGLDKQKLEEWLPVLERVVSLVKLGICKVIISSRCSVLKAAKAYLPEFIYSGFSVMSLFSNIHIVDLSKEFQLSDDERMAIIQCHMANLPNSMKIDEQEVLSSYRQYLGFPMLCRILTTDKLHLSHLNNEEILIMYTAGMIDRIYHTERLKYITLVFIALCDSKLHKSILAELSSNEETLLHTIADLCSLEFHTGLTDRLIDAAECLSETFVHYKSNEDTFELTDACVYNAVCLTFGKRHPHIVLQSCTEEFIQCFLTTNIKLGYDLKPRLYVSRSQFKVLAQRVLAILSSRFDGVTRMKVLDKKDFVDYFFRYLFETDKLEPFLTETVKKPVQNGLRSILFFCEDRLPFLAMILMQLYGLYDQEIERVLKYFLTVKKHACIEIIHKYTENRYILDAECKAEKVCLNIGYTADGDEKDFNDDLENVDKASGAVSKQQNPLIKDIIVQFVTPLLLLMTTKTQFVKCI
ncbi:hypothetical protein KUTeg_010391 [Tegillarca granosa]|uniref:Novel STAND NTPase 3 domain-containing protein n=1 Tax=Tegillarca granosa TaxID=220873 RepID=A0ABQ9FBI3_TEGGR|nr:hypothetical protein KUTeg_010391 [Tegillarca granosa]